MCNIDISRTIPTTLFLKTKYLKYHKISFKFRAITKLSCVPLNPWLIPRINIQKSNLYRNGFIVKKLIYWSEHTHNRPGWRSKSHQCQSKIVFITILGHCLTTYPGSGRTFTTYPGRDVLLRHTRVGTYFYDIPGSGRSLTTNPGQTNIYNAALNDNKIPHIGKLANIIPIPKPNKDINIGTSYRPISLLSVFAKTLEKVIFLYIT